MIFYNLSDNSKRLNKERNLISLICHKACMYLLLYVMFCETTVQ